MKLNENEIVRDITLEDIPEIELYVDQIITLLNQYTLDKEKYLTKAMINNYSKAKIIEKIKGRKYSKAHIIIIAIINRLKQTLTINEIKLLMDKVNLNILDKDEAYILAIIEKIYQSYTDIFSQSYNDSEKLDELLLNASKENSRCEYLLIEALCLSALSQSYQQKVKNSISTEIIHK
ncbi:MAG: DUF1836 domain-containing protein [Oscillospiraceae bacterium]